MSNQLWFNGRKNFLILAEKPSQLRALKAAFPVGLKNLQFEALSGHCLALADLSLYSRELTGSWLELTERKLVPYLPKTFRRIAKDARSNQIIAKVAAALRFADGIVLACDPDNEGMALGVEVLQHLKVENKIIGAINTSKLDSKSLSAAVQSIDQVPWKTMAAAGLARAEYDWSLGINGTILASVLLGQGNTLHVGGVKLPTLRLVVEREQQIAEHKVELYYTLEGRARHVPSGQLFDFQVKVDHHTELSKRTAELVQSSFLSHSGATVTDWAERLNLEQAPPKPFSLADLQSEAFARWKLTPANVLQTAQTLYEEGFISYPRTDCRYYAQGQMAEIGSVLENLIKQGPPIAGQDFPRPLRASTSIFQDKRINAHTALSPTAKFPPEGKLTAVQQKVYNLIAVRYAIQFMRKTKYNSYALLCKPNEVIPKLQAIEIQLFSSENVITDPGWKALYGSSFGLDAKEAGSLPRSKPGDAIKILEIEVKEHKTRPPPRFSEASLIQAMEKISSLYVELKGTLKSGIGTPATRARILQDLLHDGYLVSKSSILHPTSLGKQIIDILPESLSNATRRAELEAQLTAITTGELSPASFQTNYAVIIKKFASDIAQIAKEQGLKPSSRKRKDNPSPKQLSFAYSLAKRLKISIPEEVLASRLQLSTWISEKQPLIQANKTEDHQQQVGIKPMFSEKQRKIVLDNCDDHRILALLDSEDRADYAPVSEWIGRYLAGAKTKRTKSSQKSNSEQVIVQLAP